MQRTRRPRFRAPLFGLTLGLCLGVSTAHAQPAASRPAPTTSSRVPIRPMQIMRPFFVQVQATMANTEIPDCVAAQVWRGRLSPTDGSGRRLTGRLTYSDRYLGSGCPVLSEEQRIGMCTGSNAAEYDARADVSAIEVPEDAYGPALGRFAAGDRGAWTLYGAQRLGRVGEPAAKRVLRPRLAMQVALRAASLRTSNSCLSSDGGRKMGALLDGQWLTLPPVLLPVETEAGRAIVHHLGGGDEIAVWAWWRADLREVPGTELLAPLTPAPTPPAPTPPAPAAPEEEEDDYLAPLVPPSEPAAPKPATPRAPRPAARRPRA